MLTWSKPNAIVPDASLRWILTTLRFYAIVASVGALAFVVISFLALGLGVLLHHEGAGHEGAGGAMVVLIAMLILFAVATYFTGGRLYGKAGSTGLFTTVLHWMGFID